MASTHYIKRQGTSLTKKQYDILSTLRTAHQNERGLVRLPIKTKHDENTLRWLQVRDWIFESTKVFEGERRFGITSRGLKLMALMDTPPGRPPHATNMCVQCGQQPRYYTSGGYRSAYCREHHNANNRARYAALKSNGYNPSLPCSRCKQAPRAVATSGRVYAYCQACRRAQNRERCVERAKMAQEAAHNGEARLCRACRNAPVHVTPRYSHTVCASCLKEKMRSARQRQRRLRRQRKIAAFFKRG